jgi:hypothetical protein
MEACKRVHMIDHMAMLTFLHKGGQSARSQPGCPGSP